MKILWITNNIFPAPSKELKITEPVTGGWMYGMANRIALVEGNRLAVATTYSGLEYKSFSIDGVIYYLLPAKSNTIYQKKLEPLWRKVCFEFNPDIIHIHGTELPHGLACIHACPTMNYIVSIQGMVSAISYYYTAGISFWDIFRHITLRDLIRFTTIFQMKKNFEKRGEFEKECLQNIYHVIGRTSWDFVHTKSINSKINYHFCNESLRDCFYHAQKWDIKRKTNFTIFLSQASYPIKGLHCVLKAIPKLKKDFPDIRLRIAGQKIIGGEYLIDKIKLSGYGSYIISLLKNLKIFDNIEFIGTLTEDQMVMEYQNAHIFVCPSSIENSPNSLGEAQIIGVPSVASYVGGIPDMITQGETGLLYRFEDVEMLADNIRRIFRNDKLALQLSANGINLAEKRHNSTINLNNMIGIYNRFFDSCSR